MSSERRAYSRHSISLNVLVTLPDAEDPNSFFPTESSNLSLAGIQLSCNADLITALLAQPKLPFTCKVEFTLPGHEHRFVLKSQYGTHRRLSQHQYVLVVMFIHEDEQQKVLLDTLLAGNP
jgi:hypothetical protein